MSDRASTVIPLPLSTVESNIWDVLSWASFLGELAWVEPLGHERYLFGLREGRSVVEVPVQVRWHARDHRVAWQEKEGRPYRGEIKLTASNGRRTRVTMQVHGAPRTVLGGLADAFGGRRRAVAEDLRRLADRLAHLPQPPRPAVRPVRSAAAGTSTAGTSAAVTAGVGVERSPADRNLGA